MRGADAIPGCVGGGNRRRAAWPRIALRRTVLFTASRPRHLAHALAPLHHCADSIAPMPLCHRTLAPTASRPRHCDCHRSPGGSNIQIRAVRIWSARWSKRKWCRSYGKSRERAIARSRDKNRRVHDMQRRRPCLGGGIFVVG